MNRRGRQKAFTLIELLVVITIIGILAALLFPVFGSIRQKAWKIASVSNLKQMSLAFAAYISDNSDVFPPSYAGGTAPHTGQRWWPSYLASYCGNDPKVFWRPGASSDWKYLGHPFQMGNEWFQSALDGNGSPTLWSGTWTADNKPIKWNYWVNDASLSRVGGTSPQRRQADFTHFDSTVMLLDGFGWGGRDRWFIWQDGTINVLWADGHVSAENPNKITTYNLSVK